MENKEEAKRKVEKTKQSYRSIAKEHATSHTTLIQTAKDEGWNVLHRTSKKISKTTKKPAHEKILKTTALRKMTEIKAELGEQYSPTDEPLIVMAARSYEEYIELAQKVAKEGYVLESPKTGGKYLNPTFNAYQAVQKTLMNVSDKLGLSIAARKRLGLKFKRPGQKQGSIFDIIAEIDVNGDSDLDDI